MTYNTNATSPIPSAMTKKFLYVVILVLSIVAFAEARSTTKARETGDATNLLPISAAINMKNSKTVLGKDVKLYFGERAPSGAVEASLGIMYAKGEASASPKSKSKAKSPKDDPACKEAMRGALARLVEQARERGANGVVRIVSYYNSIAHASATDYECHADTSHVIVELRGEVVKLDAATKRQASKRR